MTAMIDESLPRIVAKLRTGEVSAEALTLTAIERHAEVGERLQAYQQWEPARALAQARAVDEARAAGFSLLPLSGIPISVKDVFGVDGYPTYAGTARRLPAIWESEGRFVSGLRQQLAVVIGKTKMVELALGGLGTNPHGAPR